jgi:hypothetical protein
LCSVRRRERHLQCLIPRTVVSDIHMQQWRTVYCFMKEFDHFGDANWMFHQRSLYCYQVIEVDESNPRLFRNGNVNIWPLFCLTHSIRHSPPLFQVAVRAHALYFSVKVKQSHYRPDRPLGFQDIEAPRFLDNRHMKVVRLSALRTGRLYPPGNIPGTHLC